MFAKMAEYRHTTPGSIRSASLLLKKSVVLNPRSTATKTALVRYCTDASAVGYGK